MRKGEQTRAAIVEAALEIASTQGLEGLTIGSIAEKMAMSKSGVFAHFGSREELQSAVLQEYETQFINAVLFPCLKEPRGLPRGSRGAGTSRSKAAGRSRMRSCRAWCLSAGC